MARPRRVGSKTSETRDSLLDAVERLILDKGYAAVTYRAVAAEAGVTAGLVQYYFPTLDDLFVASIQRYTERNVAKLEDALKSHPDGLRRLLWEYSRDDASSALIMEYMALANHRRSIRSEIAKVTRRVQKIQLAALEASAGDDDPPALVLLFLLTGVPRLLKLYDGLGLPVMQHAVVDLVERYLDAVEPPSKGRGTEPGSQT